MKKLYLYFKSFSLILLCSAGLAQGMEITVPQPNSQVPSLKQLCLDFIGQNAQQVNLVDNLSALPADAASKAIQSINDVYAKENKIKLIELAQSNELDRSVSCAIAAKTKDIALAYELAKNGLITDDVASIIVEDFLNTDVITYLSNVDETFNKIFPQEILGYDNDNCIRRVLLNEINYVSFEGWKANEESQVFMQDFEQNQSIEEIADYAAKKYFFNKNFDKACTDGVVVLSPCKKFLAFCEKHSDGFYMVIEIHNLKSRNKIRFTGHLMNLGKGFDKPKIAFNKDGSCFGMLDKDGNIYSIEIASTMNSMMLKDVSLSKVASLAYCVKQTKKKYYYQMLKDIVFESSMGPKEKMLSDFIHVMDMASIPLCVIEELEQWSTHIRGAYTLIQVLETASKELNMTKKELLTKWLIEPDQQLQEQITRSIENLEDNVQLNLMDAFRAFINPLIQILINGR